MPIDLSALLLWGVPGAIVWLAGQVLVFRGVSAGGRKSPAGLRLSMAGIGLVGLGMMAALGVAALSEGRWLLALGVVVLIGWWPAFFFWLATRPSVTTPPRDETDS